MQRLPAWYARNQLYDKPRIDIVAILNSEYHGWIKTIMNIAYSLYLQYNYNKCNKSNSTVKLHIKS